MAVPVLIRRPEAYRRHPIIEPTERRWPPAGDRVNGHGEQPALTLSRVTLEEVPEREEVLRVA